jgi:hypothetical protein
MMRTASVALLLVGLLVLVALGSAGGEWGGGGAEREVPGAFVDAAYTGGILLLIALAVLVVWAFTGPRAGVRVERPRGFSQVGFAFFALVLLFWYGYERRRDPQAQEEDADGVPGTPGAAPDTPEGFADAPGPEFQWWIAAAAVLAIVAVVLNERRRRARETPATAAQELEDVLTQTLAELEAELDADPRRAVIQAYARMERVLEARGHGRRPHEAPLEYLARILHELEVTPAPVEALTDLFEHAKFSHHPVDPAMKARAIDALEGIRAELRPHS